ncbi:MAG: hypothetical protein ABEH77_01690 [Halobacteriaceae archaeon]
MNYSGIPGKLKDRDTWVCWRYVWKPDREQWAKIPVNPHTGERAKANDPDTWGPFDTAKAYHENTDTDSDGLGFMFAPEDSIVGVDIDDARNSDSGRPTDTATDIVRSLDSFTEVSPSGTGYHVYVVGTLPDDAKNRSGKVEIYDGKRFFTVTGHHVDTTPATVEERGDSLRCVHSEYVADTDTTDDTHGRENTASGEADPIDLSDDELLEKAHNAEYGDEFSGLWNGDTSGYDSHSEADYHLCRHLLFWTGGDGDRVDRLFRRSGLMRPKWDEPRGEQTYGERTIEAADRGVSSYYDPSKENEQEGPGQATPPEWVGSDTENEYLSPAEVAAYAGIEAGEDETLADAIATLTDREKAAIVWDLLKRSDKYHVRVHRKSGELYAYDSGVWTPEGERTLRHAARHALGSTNYGSKVLKELKAQARSDPVAEVAGDTLGLDPGVLADQRRREQEALEAVQEPPWFDGE